MTQHKGPLNGIRVIDLGRHQAGPAASLQDVLEADAWARREAQAAIGAAAGVFA